MLTDEGTTIVKFFLHIDRDEQRQRLQARYDDPTKRWKFTIGDLEERKLWDDYQVAYEDMLGEDARPTGRRGTSSRPTASGSATWRSPTIVADTLEEPEARGTRRSRPAEGPPDRVAVGCVARISDRGGSRTPSSQPATASP